MSTPEARELKKDFYTGYPHSNGFADDGKSIILGKRESDSGSLWKIALDTGDEQKLCEFEALGKSELWFDVARDTNQLVTVANNTVWLYDLGKPGAGRRLYTGGDSVNVATLSSITADGTRVVVGEQCGENYALLSIDTRSGGNTVLFEKPWYAGHFHFSPHDEEWIGFCHEGLCDTIPDRVWAWHPRLAPQGRCILDQHWDDPSRTLYVGHERWSHHEVSVFAVAYGVSPGEPRGIYQATPDGGTRLVSEGNRDWHVNVSPSGRWVVVDTTGPHDRPGRGWDNSDSLSDILLIDPVTGRREWLARSSLDSHPYHPHPVFSPDEKTIFYNQANLERRGNRVMCVENPWHSQ